MSTLTSSGVALTVETFRAQNDGCLAYLVVDEASRTALAIDPRLDQVDRLLQALTTRDVRLTHDGAGFASPDAEAPRRHDEGDG